MNRQQRRAAARRSGADHGHGLGCGCATRQIEAVGGMTCPACGTEVGPSRFALATSAPVGSMMNLEAGCACGVEFSVAGYVAA